MQTSGGIRDLLSPGPAVTLVDGGGAVFALPARGARPYSRPPGTTLELATGTMKTLLFLMTLFSAQAELPNDPDRVWMNDKGIKRRAVVDASEDREWMSDGRVRKLKQASEDREWMGDGRVRRLKQVKEDREWMTDGQVRRLRQVKEDREWMQDGGIRRLKQAREDREWLNDRGTKRREVIEAQSAPAVTRTAEIVESAESAR